MSKEKQQDRIDDHLLGRSSAEERLEFGEELSRNAELSNQFADTQQALAAIELAEDAKLKARLQSLEQTLTTPKATTPPSDSAVVKKIAPKPEARIRSLKRSRGNRSLLGLVAALLLALVAGWWALRTGPAVPDYEQLAMDAFTPYENIAGTTVRGAEDDPAAAAFAAYDNGDFKLAETEFSALPPTNVNQFYLAQSHLAQEHYAAAGNLFSQLAKRPDFALAPEAEYYHAISELALVDEDNGIEGALFSLQRIADTEGHPFSEEAKALLKKL